MRCPECREKDVFYKIVGKEPTFKGISNMLLERVFRCKCRKCGCRWTFFSFAGSTVMHHGKLYKDGKLLKEGKTFGFRLKTAVKRARRFLKGKKS